MRLCVLTLLLGPLWAIAQSVRDVEITNDEADCNVYEINYDSLDAYIDLTLEAIDKLQLKPRQAFDKGTLREEFIERNTRKQRKSTKYYRNVYFESTPTWFNSEDDSDMGLSSQVLSSSPISPYPAIRYRQLNSFNIEIKLEIIL